METLELHCLQDLFVNLPVDTETLRGKWLGGCRVGGFGVRLHDLLNKCILILIQRALFRDLSV